MNKFNAKLPIGEIKQAIRVCNASKKQIFELNKKLETIEADIVAGRIAPVQAEQNKAKINAEAAEIITKAVSDVQAARENANKILDDQFLPDGADITGENANDYALLNAGLITDPSKLQQIINKHDNPAFRMLADKYAQSMNWEGFEFISTEIAIREYCNHVFDGLDGAAAKPFGYSSMQFTEQKDEYARMAKEHGIISEFWDSNGASIETCITAETGE